MSAPRIARAGRTRFFIGLGILVLTIGFVAIFQSSQQQLNELRHMELKCEREQQALNNRLEDAERSIRTEKHSHQQTKDDLESKAKEQKETNDKSLLETNVKLTSLQQHYKLLKSQHDDSTDECAKAKARQSEEINVLQKKIKSLETQNEHAIKEREMEIELLKAKHNQLVNEKNALEQVVKEKKLTMPDLPSEVEKLKRIIAEFKEHTDWRPTDYQLEHPQDVQTARTSQKNVDISFSAQIPVSQNLYEIPIKHGNQTAINTNSMQAIEHQKQNNALDNNNKPLNGTIVQTVGQNGGGNIKARSLGVINSVENFQLMQKPLAEPLASDALKSSTAKIASAKTSEASIVAKFNAPIAPAPDQVKASSTTAANRKAEENFGKPKAKQVPNGVVPIQENLEDIINQNVDNSQAAANGNENAARNNRYVNVVDEVGGAAASAVADAINSKIDKKKAAAVGQQTNNDDNVAQEVNDNNDFIMYDRSHKDHMQAALGDANINAINNAAEEDLNLYDNKFNLAKPNENGDELDTAHKGDSNKLQAQDDSNKLMNEIDGDQGRVGYEDDGHLEEQQEEEDDDEYANLAARKQDPAIRN